MIDPNISNIKYIILAVLLNVCESGICLNKNFLLTKWKINKIISIKLKIKNVKNIYNAAKNPPSGWKEIYIHKTKTEYRKAM